MIHVAISAQYQNVTDRQTDERTVRNTTKRDSIGRCALNISAIYTSDDQETEMCASQHGVKKLHRCYEYYVKHVIVNAYSRKSFRPIHSS